MALSPALIAIDPQRPARTTAWMRGITPARLGYLALVCVVLAARPALWNADPGQVVEALREWAFMTAHYFVFALPMFILVIKAEIRTVRSPASVRIWSFVAAVLFGAAVFSTRVWITPVSITPYIWQWQLAFFVRALAIGGLLAAIVYFAAREADAQRELHRFRIARQETERQTAEANLHRLQAQLEPHFLFNSLASIKRLYERDPGRGRAMLRNLGDYVRAASARAGQADATLASEIALAKSFLEIFQVRMGARLRVRIEVPLELETALVPTLMIATLVENAIKHGIAPRATGGTVRISASREADRLRVDVADDGIGFRAESGHGVGLSNTRARLAAAFGESAGLELAANPEGGVRAMLWLPCRFAAPAP